MATSIMPGFFPLVSGNDTTPASETTVNNWIAQQMQRWVDFITPLNLTPHASPAGQASFPNYTTVPIPATGAITVELGYNYYRFSDALQATEPVFFKITWRVLRRGTTTHQYHLAPNIEVGVCDANGVFSITTGTFVFSHNGTSPGFTWNTTAQPYFGCYTGDYLYLGFSRTTGSPNGAPTGYIAIERGKSIDGGSPNRPGIMIASRRWNGTTSTSADQSIAAGDIRTLRRSDGAQPQIRNQTYTDSTSVTHADGANNWVWRHGVFDGGPMYMSGFFTYLTSPAEYGDLSMFTLPKLGGGVQTVLALPVPLGLTAASSSSNLSSITRWE